MLSSSNNLIKNGSAKLEVEDCTQVEKTSTKSSAIGNYVGAFEPDYGCDENFNE